MFYFWCVVLSTSSTLDLAQSPRPTTFESSRRRLQPFNFNCKPYSRRTRLLSVSDGAIESLMYAAMGLPGLTKKPERVLEPGDIVKIVGLKAAKEHNGKEGVLGEYVSHEDGDHAGRWRVTILGTKTSLGVKRANLQFMRPKELESIPNQGRGRTSSGAGAGRGPPAGQDLGSALEILQQPMSWAIGLSIDKQYEWLCDCYRMRMDDLYCWGGGELRGIMACDASPHSLATEFLAFCKLAVMNKVVPLDLPPPTQPFAWNWGEFLDVSAGLVIYAFEKSDAKEKYGQENVFAAMMGGRSLRLTGEVVYGSSCQSGKVCGIKERGCFSGVQKVGLNIDYELWSHREFDQEECPKKFRFQETRVDIFADVGGRDLWLKFHDRLEQNPGPNLHSDSNFRYGAGDDDEEEWDDDDEDEEWDDDEEELDELCDELDENELTDDDDDGGYR